jgi:hypothetical protein
MRVRFGVPRRLRPVLVLPLVLGVGACFHVFYHTTPRPLASAAAGASDSIRTPIKAHLLDGSTVVFAKGARVTSTEIRGDALSYPLMDTVGTARTVVPLDSVIGAEAFDGRFDAFGSLVVSAGATALGVLVVMAGAVALFGSCPTVYAPSDSGPVLQAEGFSYAISPLLEHRDVDPITLRPGPDGALTLELRNEALETHRINHVELLSVRHRTGDRVVPDQHGTPVLVGDLQHVASALDRAGRDVRAEVRARDASHFESDRGTIARAREGDLDDWIDLEAPRLPPGDSVAVVLRLRNSLLNTILLYDGMLGGRDALDWLGYDLRSIAPTVDLARWYVGSLGMRAIVEGVPRPEDQAFDGHARLGDVGPIAFREVALVLPRPADSEGPTRIRLRFVADNWRIDEVRVASRIERPAVLAHPLRDVIVPTPAVGNGPVRDLAAVTAMSAPDEAYLETRPGQRMMLHFAPDRDGDPMGDSTTTRMIAWQGWYREWVRGGWLAEPTRTEPFVPGDAAMLTALRRWTERRESYERDFHATKIPVR